MFLIVVFVLKEMTYPKRKMKTTESITINRNICQIIKCILLKQQKGELIPKHMLYVYRQLQVVFRPFDVFSPASFSLFMFDKSFRVLYFRTGNETHSDTITALAGKNKQNKQHTSKIVCPPPPPSKKKEGKKKKGKKRKEKKVKKERF